LFFLGTCLPTVFGMATMRERVKLAGNRVVDAETFLNHPGRYQRSHDGAINVRLPLREKGIPGCAPILIQPSSPTDTMSPRIIALIHKRRHWCRNRHDVSRPPAPRPQRIQAIIERCPSRTVMISSSLSMESLHATRQAVSNRVHADRTAGGDCHYRHPD